MNISGGNLRATALKAKFIYLMDSPKKAEIYLGFYAEPQTILNETRLELLLNIRAIVDMMRPEKKDLK